MNDLLNGINSLSVDYMSYQHFSPPENLDILSTKTLIRQKFDFVLINEGFPSSFAKFLLERAIISGGISASILNGEKVNDIDIFMKSEDDIKIVEESLSNQKMLDLIVDVNPKYSGTEKIPGKMVTSRAITFKGGLQVITMHGMDARKTFDFIHTMPYLDLKDNVYYISKPQFDSIKQKKLVRNPHPDAFQVTESRIEKFKSRGWDVSGVLK